MGVRVDTIILYLVPKTIVPISLLFKNLMWLVASTVSWHIYCGVSGKCFTFSSDIQGGILEWNYYMTVAN